MSLPFRFGSTRSSLSTALATIKPVMTASFDPTEERGLMDSRALPRRGQIPVAVEIAVPAELAAKFCFGISFGKCGELGFGVPGR